MGYILEVVFVIVLVGFLRFDGIFSFIKVNLRGEYWCVGGWVRFFILIVCYDIFWFSLEFLDYEWGILWCNLIWGRFVFFSLLVDVIVSVVKSEGVFWWWRD